MIRFAVALIALGLASLPSQVAAQETFSGPLALGRTYIKVGMPVFFDHTAVEALTPTMVSCPGMAGMSCTLRIEVSSQFNGVPIDNVAVVTLSFDGSAEGILPSNSLGFDSTSNDGASNVRTFTWLKSVTAGTHTVRVTLRLASPAAYAAGSWSRTLTIAVYKP